MPDLSIIETPAVLSSEALAVHLRAMLPNVEGVPIARLRDDLSVGCVDGRRGTCGASVPGGNAGLFILMLGAYEQDRGRTLEQSDVDELLHEYLDAFGTFYLHSDEAAASRLTEYLGLADVEETARRIGEVPLDASILDAMLLPEHIGCGHLQSMLDQPDAYGVRQELVQAALRAIYSHQHDDRVVFEVLGGTHAERAVVRVRAVASQGTPLPLATLCPHFGDTDVFVYHPDAAAYLEAAHGLFLAESGRIASEAIPAFVAAQHSLAEQQLNATLSALAHDLPVFDVRFTFNSGSKPQLTVSPA